INQGSMDWMTAIDRLSTAPAKIAGVQGGTLKVSSAADVVVIDPSSRWTVDGNQFVSRCNSSTLDGYQLDGIVRLTIVDGEIRHDNS
ncbi:amidohydrolase family protein, partial [Rubripirellula sp.]